MFRPVIRRAVTTVVRRACSAAASSTRHHTLFCIALLSVAFAPSLRAQRPTAADVPVIGFVTDSAGHPLANVQVVARALNKEALTDDRGEFILRGLPAGTHHLDLVRIGYVATHQVIVVPPAGSAVRLTIVMQVASVRLSSVNVTANPTGGDALAVTQATVQLGGKELQRALSTSIGQTLAKEPGMSSRFNGPLAATPVIRGLTGERVLVLQDGTRSGDLSSAAADHLNAVDPSSAERIEVIRGPASLLYGNNALGGVVNVISSDIPTAIPPHISGYVLGQGESVTPGGVVNAGVTVPLSSRLAVTARGGFRDVGQMRVGGGATQPNTDGSTQQVTAGAGYVGPRLSLGAVYRQMDFEYGLPHAEGDEAVRIDGRRRSVGVQGTVNTGVGAMSTVRVDQTAQWYQHGEIEETGEVGTRFELNTQTTNLTARTQLGRVTGSMGVQGLFRQYQPKGEEAFTPAANNDNVAVFAYQEFPLTSSTGDRHAPLLQVGARFDRFSIRTRPGDDAERFGAAQTRSYNNLAASLGLSVPLNETVALTGNVSRGFRAPAVEELFANGYHAAVGTFDVGNTALEAERATGVDIGLRAQSRRTFAQLGAYANRIDGYIAPVTLGTTSVDGALVPRVTFAGRDATLAGLEGQVETKLVHHLVGGLMGDYTRASIRGSDEKLPFIPAGRLGASLRFDNGKLSAGGDVRHVFAQDRVTGDELDVATTAYTLLDISASWLFTVAGRQVHALTLRVDNALDEQYRDATSRIKRFAYNPGRNLSVVYKLLY
jgi:iron complex outermembrane receptor protein